MKQATKIIITDREGIRLTISLDSSTEKQECTITEMAIQFYKRLSYLIHKDYELERSFYEEENIDISIDNDVESEDVDDEDSEAHFYDDRQYK